MEYSRVEVTWHDANSEAGWITLEAAKELLPQLCKSLGYLLVKDEVAVILVQSVQEGNDDVGDALCIPTECVLNIDYETFNEQIA